MIHSVHYMRKELTFIFLVRYSFVPALFLEQTFFPLLPSLSKITCFNSTLAIYELVYFSTILGVLKFPFAVLCNFQCT